MRKLFVVFVMLVAMNVNAQWVQMSNGMGIDTLVTTLAVNGNNIFAGTRHGVYISTNYGTAWTQTSLNSTSVNSIVISGNTIYAGGNNPYGVYYSINNGSNWTLTSVASFSINTITVIGNTILAGSSFGLYRSTNNGVSWDLTNLDYGHIFTINVIGEKIFAGSENGLYRSTNNGLNWSLIGLNGKVIYSLTSIANVFYAGTFNYGVYKSIDTCSTWIQSTLNNENAVSIVGSGNNIFVGTLSNGIYLSTNSGANWILKNQGFNLIPTSPVLMTSNNYIFAGTVNKSIWRRSLSEIIRIQNISTETPSSYSLSQNYPNPFNPTTNIKFSIIKTEQIKLIVYDVQGREVQTLVNESLRPGTYEAAFDASALTTGIYFYKLITNTFSETKKMLLIK
jgi:hypothetical protein